MPPSDAYSWRALILSLAPDAQFKEPVTEIQLTSAKDSLDIYLPEQLHELLEETDGITADYGTGIIWPLKDILLQNQIFRTKRDFRELYMPFDHLLFFGDDGSGDQFAFAIDADGQIRKSTFTAGNMKRTRVPGLPVTWKVFFKKRLKRQN